MIDYRTYCAIESEAGGVAASRRALIRIMRNRLVKHNTDAMAPRYRRDRHALYRELLKYHQRAVGLVEHFRL